MSIPINLSMLVGTVAATPASAGMRELALGHLFTAQRCARFEREGCAIDWAEQVGASYGRFRRLWEEAEAMEARERETQRALVQRLTAMVSPAEPDLCLGCGARLLSSEDEVCDDCAPTYDGSPATAEELAVIERIRGAA